MVADSINRWTNRKRDGDGDKERGRDRKGARERTQQMDIRDNREINDRPTPTSRKNFFC